jgi:RNA polymerase primary sigma factor
MERPLDAWEVRLLADADVLDLRDFASSPRLYAVDGKGDTPLHIAARCGRLAVCDMLVRYGADPNATNTDDQTAAEVAAAEGHLTLSQLLKGLELEGEPDAALVLPESQQSYVAAEAAVSVQIAKPLDQSVLELSFEPEADPGSFRIRKGLDQGEAKPPTFVPVVASLGEGDAADWELDLSQASVAGDGIGDGAVAAKAENREGEFLVTRSRGRKSTKPARLPVGTKISIDPFCCEQWAVKAINSQRFSEADIEALVNSCWGNADRADLWYSISHISNVAGLEFAENEYAALFDQPVVADEDDLTEALEAALTRQTPLPGVGRFLLDRTGEDELVAQMLQAKAGLNLAVVSSEEAVRVIVRFADMVLAGKLRPEYLTLVTVFPEREDDPGSNALREAADTLRSVAGDGAILEGKRRRSAIQALDRIELSAVFFKALSKFLSDQPGHQEVVAGIHYQLAELQNGVERLIVAHLPYVRRFSSRFADEGEDLEDVFQVAFMGMQRSTTRFEPNRGVRFLMYAAYWMRQAISRWRADEGAIVRIPVHRHTDLAALDEALDRLQLSLGRLPTGSELADDREWNEQHVERLLATPRVQVEWDELDSETLLVPAEQEAQLEEADTSRVVADALSELRERHADVIRKRFGFDGDGEMTLEEVGRIYGVTRERIRQIEAQALRQLSHAGRIKKLRGLLEE